MGPKNGNCGKKCAPRGKKFSQKSKQRREEGLKTKKMIKAKGFDAQYSANEIF